MYSADDMDRVKLIQVKIEYILDVCSLGVVKALEDVKGAIDARNFIAHDYEGINLPIVEFIIRERLPVLQKVITEIFK